MKSAYYGILVMATCLGFSSAFPSHCTCTRNLVPVCGSDGVTYGNPCLLECAGAALQHQGRCDGVQEKTCDCFDPYRPVCGSDGHTYFNECDLNCAKAFNADLIIARQGDCAPKPCGCTEAYSPVCASDGNTYASKCEFDCAATNTSITLKHEGACRGVKIVTLRRKRSLVECRANCEGDRDLVCGMDEITYLNSCYLKCEGQAKKHDGGCTGGVSFTWNNYPGIELTKVEVSVEHHVPEKKVLDCQAHCEKDRNLVCGEDGTSYLNQCFMECSDQKKAHDGACPIKSSYTITETRGPWVKTTTN